jgi:hypothetical protein
MKNPERLGSTDCLQKVGHALALVPTVKKVIVPRQIGAFNESRWLLERPRFAH